MDSEKFDVMARLFTSGQTRRDALRGLLAGSAAMVAGAALLGDEASARPKKRQPKKRRPKDRCKKAGKFCDKNKECCPGKTKRRCAVAVNAGNSDKTCCGGQGAVCGGANQDGDDIGPFCCVGFECSSETRAKGKCVRVPEI